MANPDIELAYATISKQRTTLDKFYRYYKGEHKLNYASDKYINKFFERLKEYVNNLCKVAVNAPVARLEVIGFASENKDIAKQAWRIWKMSKMPLNSKTVFREGYKTGAGYVLVWQDPATKKARLFPQEAKNCKIWYDPETGDRTKAAKLWKENKQWFLTLYYPDRIEKYATSNSYSANSTSPTSAGVFKLRKIAGEANPSPNPWGIVPLFEFKPLEGDSILADVVPLQDGLNKTGADILVGGEYNTLRQRWTAGVVFEQDPETGQKIIEFKHDDSIWSSDDNEAKFGEFSDVDLEKFLKVAAEIRQDIARVTRIPAHFFNLNTGNFPSGEALETAESPFISLVEDAQLSFGETWGEVMSFALTIENALPNKEPLEVQWQDPARPSLMKRLQTGVLKIQVGVSQEAVQSELGYTDDEIAQFKIDNQARATAAGDALGKIFDAGGVNPINSATGATIDSQSTPAN